MGGHAVCMLRLDCMRAIVRPTCSLQAKTQNKSRREGGCALTSAPCPIQKPKQKIRCPVATAKIVEGEGAFFYGICRTPDLIRSRASRSKVAD